MKFLRALASVFLLIIISITYSEYVLAATGVSPSSLQFQFKTDSEITKKVFIQNFNPVETVYDIKIEPENKFVKIISPKIFLQPDEIRSVKIQINKPLNYRGQIQISSALDKNPALNIQTLINIPLVSTDQRNTVLVPVFSVTLITLTVLSYFMSRKT